MTPLTPEQSRIENGKALLALMNDGGYYLPPASIAIIKAALSLLDELAKDAETARGENERINMTRAEDERLRKKWAGAGTKDWKGLDD